MLTKNKTIITMKLDSEDYENIYLRVRGKLWLFLTSLITIFGGAGLIVIYLSINTAIEKAVEKAVEKYIQSDEFKKNIITVATGKITELNKRADLIEINLEHSEKRIANLSTLPVTVNENGLAIMDQSGKKFFIESGTIKDGQSIEFVNLYTKKPIVILNATGDMFGPYSERITSSRAPSNYAQKVTTDGFSLRPNVSPKTYSWIALGL